MSTIATTTAVSNESWAVEASFAPRRRRAVRTERFGWQDVVAYILTASVLTLSAVLPALLGRY